MRRLWAAGAAIAVCLTLGGLPVAAQAPSTAPPGDTVYPIADAPVPSVEVAVRLQDGRWLVAGGGAAYVFDPETGAFARTGPPPSMGLGAGGATLLRDGRVLVPGGSGLYDAPAIPHLYDPATGMFTPTATMSEPRYVYSATLLPDDRVLIAGGTDAAFWTRVYDSAELFDPRTGEFTPTGTMAVARFGHFATLLPDGRVLIVGGTDGVEKLASAEIYDPTTGTFTMRQSVATATPAP